MFKNPFSFKGRIRRTEYGISVLIYILTLVIFNILLDPNNSENSNSIEAIIYLILFVIILWFNLAQGAKRCHDLGNNGWWQLIPFYFFWLLFEEGESRINRYGVNPKIQTFQNTTNANSQTTEVSS